MEQPVEAVEQLNTVEVVEEVEGVEDFFPSPSPEGAGDAQIRQGEGKKLLNLKL